MDATDKVGQAEIRARKSNLVSHVGETWSGILSFPQDGIGLEWCIMAGSNATNKAAYIQQMVSPI